MEARGKSAGEGGSWAKLVPCIHKALLTYIRSILKPRYRRIEPLEDVAQEVFLKAHRKRGDFTGESEEDFLLWLQCIADGIVKNLVRTVLRKRRCFLRSEFLEELQGAQREPASGELSAEEILSKEETALRVREALDACEDTHAGLAKLVFLNGIPIARVAATEGLSDSTVRKRLERELRWLRFRVPAE
jgi:RNA polymerase sigma factor (sigma-70 family)